MNIVFVGPFGLQPKGTMSVRALPLARALVKRGHRVTVLIPPWDDPDRTGQQWADGGVQVVNVPLLPGPPLIFEMRLTLTLVRYATALKPDVIHFFKPKAYAGLSHWLCRWLRRRGIIDSRLVLDSDDWEQAWNDKLPYPGWQKKLFTRQEQWGLRHADAVTVASRALEESARQAQSGPVVYVPNGAVFEGRINNPNADFTPQMVRMMWQLDESPTVLLYSRFLEFRLERIVSLVRRVAESMPAARWLIVGQGLDGEDERLRQQLVEADLAAFVRFTGWLPVEQLAAHFQAANVAIFPYDDTPINRTKCSVKLIDLLLAGLPVVADAVGQNCEYIESGISGVLVPTEDDAAFAAVLIDVLGDPAKQRRLGQAAAAAIRQNYDWSDLALRVEQAYHA
ncbi:MAG: glycosyltransferase family 4 protein [Anaerolineae bacterium]|nr:glycosyltransferase family 4 protein [Anaerolineae bacterium]